MRRDTRLSAAPFFPKYPELHTRNPVQEQSSHLAKTEAFALAAFLDGALNVPNEQLGMNAAREKYDRIMWRASSMEVTLQCIDALLRLICLSG